MHEIYRKHVALGRVVDGFDFVIIGLFFTLFWIFVCFNLKPIVSICLIFLNDKNVLFYFKLIIVDGIDVLFDLLFMFKSLLFQYILMLLLFHQYLVLKFAD